MLGDSGELVSLRKELNDRYGAIPGETEKLLALMEIRMLCRQLHITRVKRSGEKVYMSIKESTPLSSSRLMGLLDSNLMLVSEFELSLKLSNKGWWRDTDRMIDRLKKMTGALDEV